MVNEIPPDHVDDVPVIEPNQHDDVPVVLEPVLVDEDEDLEEDKIEEEEDPQEEEDDMEVDIEEDENEPELNYPSEEVDPLNPPPPASKSEPEDAIEGENLIEHEDETVLASIHEVGESSTAPFLCEDSDGLLAGLMRREINSLFGRMASLSRLLCGRKMAHALVEKKGKAKDEYYGKLILDLGNEVRSSVEQGTAAMEKLVEKLGNAEDKVECKKLKKELEEVRIMPPRHANVGNDARGSGPARGQDVTPATRECNFAGFMKYNPTIFHEGKKARFAAATLQGPVSRSEYEEGILDTRLAVYPSQTCPASPQDVKVCLQLTFRPADLGQDIHQGVKLLLLAWLLLESNFAYGYNVDWNKIMLQARVDN
ncbi:hypothetical protein Tco_0786864 [Tanacetum coccineum]